MGVGGTIGTAGKGFRGPKGAKMALHMGMHISRPSVGSEQMLLLSRKTHSILSPAIHLYPAKWNQVSLLIVGPTRLRRTIRQGSFLSKLAEEQKHIRVQQYHYAAEKSVKKKGRMSVSIGSIVTLGAVIRFKFPLIVPKRFLGQLSSICCLTLLSSHSQAAKEVSRYPDAVKKQHVATVYSDTSNTKTAKSETIKATEKFLQDEKLPRSSGSVVDQSFSLAEKDREILKGSHSLQEDSNRDRLVQESCVIDKISDSSSKFGSLSGKITCAPVEDDGGLTDGTVSCSACTAPEPKSEVTIIAFDIETTGLKLSDDRIIEFAARDLAGGKCSTLQTLVNPGQKVPYSVTLVHGIKDEMVNRTDVPSWREVAIAILQFVEIRRKGGPVILVAHNGKRFDVPFIMKEFHDCSMEVPSWWYFVDSLSLAREVMKANGSKFTTLKLSSLHEYYGLPSQGRAHRAMADVHMLASVFGMLMKDLQLPVSGLLERAFKAEDIMLKIVKTGVPLPSVDHLQEKLQEELQSLSLTDEDDTACSNVEDDDDLIEVNVARLNESGNDASVPWEDSQMDNLDKEITGKDCLQLVQGISENVEVNESGFSVEGEKSLSLSTYPQVDKLQPLIISHTIQTEDKHQNKSIDLPKTQPDEMALFLDSENVDSDPVCTGMRQLEGGSMNIWTETEIKVLTSISESSTDVDSPLEKALLFDNVKIAGADRANISKCFIKSLSASNEWALHTSSVDTSLLSPMMKQHVEMKRQRPEFMLLSRVGDFYEAFFEDAEVLATACNLKVGAVDGGKLSERRVPRTGVPHHKIDFYLRMLLSKGITVVKQDQQMMPCWRTPVITIWYLSSPHVMMMISGVLHMQTSLQENFMQLNLRGKNALFKKFYAYSLRKLLSQAM
ncbi:hypothetical protein O6H91_09G110700 [Diphasiastrum complanatum]|uniref:Uncharacterized protein n=1 Tax=Diphasiastrum complanatum TaxID=34168 RepID=A0ACC2CU87_DIPCM|nr:hypothetical protein O6H91_09G110700 [Diphasiastrum complanatum]